MDLFYEGHFLFISLGFESYEAPVLRYKFKFVGGYLPDRGAYYYHIGTATADYNVIFKQHEMKFFESRLLNDGLESNVSTH